MECTHMVWQLRTWLENWVIIDKYLKIEYRNSICQSSTTNHPPHQYKALIHLSSLLPQHTSNQHYELTRSSPAGCLTVQYLDIQTIFEKCTSGQKYTSQDFF